MAVEKTWTYEWLFIYVEPGFSFWTNNVEESCFQNKMAVEKTWTYEPLYKRGKKEVTWWRASQFLLFTKNYLGDQMKEDDKIWKFVTMVH
jgi:hypothetical protein